MSQEIIDQLTQELANYKTGVDGLNAQLDATKQMFNECSIASLNLRTSNILLQRKVQELSEKNNKLQQDLNASSVKQESSQPNLEVVCNE